MRRLLLSLLCLFALSCLPAIAAERVGLVLSGGAARGLAHIGVLKALEEQGIRIDAIAGTSMGAIVGGLYASGYSVAELERLALELDWQQALSDSPPREDIPFRRKQDDRDFLIKQKLSFRDDGSLGLPLGVIQGQNLALLLESLLVHRSATRQVMRASMSIPAVFAPVEVDGRLLVDGGMVNNVPIDVARQMGVDHVIVVDLGMPLKPAKELLTVVDVMNQSINLMMRKNSEAQLETLEADDVLILPPLAGFGVADFNRGEQMMDAGYRATQIQAERLARLRTSSAGNPALAMARSREQRTPVIREIQVENDSKVGDAVIRRHIRQPLGEPLDMDRLQKDMGTLYGLDYFERVQYRVEPLDERGSALVIDARGKRTGTDYLRLGLNLSDDMRGDSAFNIGASYRINGINELGAEWLTRLQLGDRQELYSEFYQPLDAGSRYFVAPYLFGEAQNVEAILDNDPIAEYRLERYGYGLNLGRQIANNGEIRFGIGQAWGEADVRVGERDLPSFSFSEGYYELLYSFDTLDNLDFPRTGEDIGLMLRKYDRGLGSDEAYRQWQLKLDKAYSHGPNTWLFGGRYGRTLDEAEVVTSGFILGGAQELSGFRQDSLSGQNMALARMIYYRRMTQTSMLPLNFPLYLGLSLERGRAWNNDNAFDSGYINAASIFLGLDTPLGPLNFSYGFNEEREKALYLNLGKSF
ncbi:MAG: hypothetical protein CVV08_20965 [Gammaproteobacteria bacterium HGW-Gammaproteobacteria-12]|nr:MAG: hypothetical protein CVV08_20965 [Gammaproteobacteria bacterium HGW-Gammaproteobacteria-12]